MRKILTPTEAQASLDRAERIASNVWTVIRWCLVGMAIVALSVVAGGAIGECIAVIGGLGMATAIALCHGA